MAGFADERRAIEERFTTNWGSTAPVRWENVEFVVPKNSEWVEISVDPGESHQITLQGQNDGINRYPGQIVIQLFAPDGSGTQEIKTLADTAAGIFRRANFQAGSSGLIRCRIPWFQQVGRNEAGNYQINVIVPYFRDVT